MRWPLIALPLALLSLAANAQTTTDLQALATQDAQQYGVPVQLFLDQIQAESSFNPNIGTSAKGATGIAQFLPSTAADPGYGIAPFNPNDPAASLAAAAQYDAALYSANGDNWTAAIQAYNGGVPLSTIGGYAAVYADAQAADSGTATTTTVDGGGTSPGAPSIPAQAAPLTAPFSWAWTYIMQAAQSHVSSLITQTENIAWGPIVPIFALIGVYWGSEYWYRELSLGELAWRVIVLALVLGFIYPGNDSYTTYVVGGVEGLPTYFAQNVNACAGNAGTSCATPVAGPAAVFDSVWQAFFTKVLNVWHVSPWYDKILVGLLLWFVIGDVVIALGSLYFTFLTANYILFVLLAIGPVFILLAVFPATSGFFRFWLDLLGALLLFVLTLDVMLGFFTIVLNQLINAVNAGVTTTWTDMLPSLAGAVIVFNVMAFANAFLTLQIGKIHGLSTRGFTAAGAAATSIWASRTAKALST